MYDCFRAHTFKPNMPLVFGDIYSKESVIALLMRTFTQFIRYSSDSEVTL